jgi:hypothetical protein
MNNHLLNLVPEPLTFRDVGEDFYRRHQIYYSTVGSVDGRDSNPVNLVVYSLYNTVQQMKWFQKDQQTVTIASI